MEEITEKTAPKQRGRPFPKGVSGNPDGRPAGSISLITLLKQRLELVGPDQKRSIAEHFIDNVMQDALEGNEVARKIVFQYIEGMPKQNVDLGIDKEGLAELTLFFKALADKKDD